MTATPTRARTGVLATSSAAVQNLLCQRTDLPAGHPHHAALRTRSIEAGLPLALCLAARYKGRGETMDDLYQVAALALVKAVDSYDPTQQTTFIAYALPCILGALKRHFRDTTWRMKVPRKIQELAIAITPASARLTHQLSRPPTLPELAAHLDATEKDVTTALNAWQARHPDSLDAARPATNGKEQRTLIDTIGDTDTRLDTLADRHTLRPLLAALPARERRILAMRYFGEMTQSEIGAQIGVSQMHVSRLLTRTLAELRTGMLTSPP
jgi:RNA polymerase sigma-B factor